MTIAGWGLGVSHDAVCIKIQRPGEFSTDFSEKQTPYKNRANMPCGAYFSKDERFMPSSKMLK